MKSVSDNFAAQFSSFGNPTDGTLDMVMMGRIGDDLRRLYDRVTDDEQPRNLLDLAEIIDARHRGDGLRD